MNTRFGSEANRQRRSQPEHILQPNTNPGAQNNLLPPPGGGDRDHIAALETRMEALTLQKKELQLRISEQSHLVVNWDEHEEEEHQSHIHIRIPRVEDR